jgi:FkbM family methyltransferase
MNSNNTCINIINNINNTCINIINNINNINNSCIFTNDNNVEIYLLEHEFSNRFQNRDKHEVLFRQINTFLINNQIIDKNKSIIDLGAWIGDNTIPWAKNIQNIVYAIDPSPNNIQYIKDTCAINHINNVVTLEYAISNTNELLSTNENINHCSFVYGNPGINGRNKVNAVSLDYLYERRIIDNIGYIHLDVEGMEYKILQGSTNIIDELKPIISFEQHLEIDDYNIILHYLINKGYQVYLVDEILPGCRIDCRNSFAFHNDIFSEELIQNINHHIGRNIMISKNNV